MNEDDYIGMLKVAEVSGVLSCLDDAGYVSFYSPESFEYAVEKIASVVDDDYGIDDVCYCLSELLD